MMVHGALGEWWSMAVYGNGSPWQSRGMAVHGSGFRGMVVHGSLGEWRSMAV